MGVQLEKKGIKEARELLVGINKIIIIMVREFKDGFQVSDLAALFTLTMDSDLKNAVDGLEKLKGEFQDLDWEEGIELSGILLSLVPEIIKELKK